MRQPRPKFYAYTFTRFIEPGESYITLFFNIWELYSDHLQYMLFGLEECPTTGRRHIQGYVFFKEPKSRSFTYLMLGKTSHFEPAREGPLPNYLYCTKHYNSVKRGSLTEAHEMWYNIVKGEQGDKALEESRFETGSVIRELAFSALRRVFFHLEFDKSAKKCREILHPLLKMCYNL